MKITHQTARQRGYGLVEFMVAMTLGLVLLGGIGYVYLGTRGSFRSTDNLSRMQENARYALDVMSRDIRMAGYAGCGNIGSIKINTIANPIASPMLTQGNVIVGYATGSGWTNPTSGPVITRAAGDVLTLTGAYGRGANLTGNLIPQNANVQVSGNPDAFKQGDVLMVTDCSQADVFRVTNSPGSSGTVTLTHANSTNTGNRVGTYGKDAFVMRIDQYSYFIGSNASGNRALYRAGLYTTEELVENVYDMRFRYGLDTNGDGMVDSYSSSPGNWTQVISVTVNLLVNSPDTNIATSSQSLTFNNATFSAAAEPVVANRRRAYQVYSATVAVRNRLPML
jgi:type IV pilus assembly protein PilW